MTASKVAALTFIAPGQSAAPPSAPRQRARTSDVHRIKTRECPGCGGPIVDTDDQSVPEHPVYRRTGKGVRAGLKPGDKLCPASGQTATHNADQQ